MSLEDFRTAYKQLPTKQRWAWHETYHGWRSASLDLQLYTPLSFIYLIYGGPGKQEHYDNTLSAFLADVFTQRLLGEQR